MIINMKLDFKIAILYKQLYQFDFLQYRAMAISDTKPRRKTMPYSCIGGI